MADRALGAAMGWSRLTTGGFTGIDWGAPDATKGYDPYLVWAETDDFSGYGGQPKWLPIVLELNEGFTVGDLLRESAKAWLRVPPVYDSASLPAGFRFCTALVKREFFKQQRTGRLRKIVKRFELGLPAGVRDPDARQEPRPVPGKPATPVPSASLLSGPVFGLIDDSLALAHASFLHGARKARTVFFWRQDDSGVGGVPAQMDYGRELMASDIDHVIGNNVYAGLVDESAVYTALGLSTMGRRHRNGRVGFHALDTTVSHGTHVADLAVGPRTAAARVANLPPGFDAPPSWAVAADRASQCPIIAVQLDYDTVRDTSGGSMNVAVLDGLAYILSRCGPDAEVVVNVSFGTIAGPHDGTSVLETAMDELLELEGERLRIVLPAGNSYQARTHANVPLTARRRPSAPWRNGATLQWVVQPDDGTQSFLELWLEPGATGVGIEITPPGGRPLPLLRWGESRVWLDDAGRALCALIYPKAVATGDGTCALVALAPTGSLKPGAATAPAGPWKVRLAHQGDDTVVDAYVERDDVVIGTLAGARQSCFEDEAYDMDAFIDDPDNPSLIRRSGNFNSIATGAHTVSAGGTRMSHFQPARGTPDPKWAHYSPRKPDPDARRPARPGVVKMPDDEGPSDENPILQGLDAAGTRSSAIVRLRGTSDVSPQVARGLLDASAPPAKRARKP